MHLDTLKRRRGTGRQGGARRAGGGGHASGPGNQAGGEHDLMGARLVAAAAAAALLVGCAEPGGRDRSRPRRRRQPTRSRYTPPDDPYPSTYRPYGGVPTAITGATIYDGEGGRIDNGTIVLVDGRIQAVGGADTPIPEGATRIDGAGRWVTPGVIDVHSPSRRLSEPRRRGPFATATRSPARCGPKSGPSTASGRRIPASRARSPMAASPRSRSCPARPTCSAAAASPCATCRRGRCRRCASRARRAA